MSADDQEPPVPAVAVSPEDHSSDRVQSDENQRINLASSEAAREQAEADLVVTNDRIDELIAAAREQAETNEELALATIEYQERARLARKRFRLTMGALLITTALVLAAIFVILNKINDSLDSGKTVRTTLLDCVQPTGDCYRQGQEQTAKVVGQLNQVTALAAACAPDYVDLPFPRRVAAIEDCIERGLR